MTVEQWRTYHDVAEKREWQVRDGQLFCRRVLPKGHTDWQRHTTIPVRLRRQIHDLFEHPTTQGDPTFPQ